jgi:hypothetical protein
MPTLPIKSKWISVRLPAKVKPFVGRFAKCLKSLDFCPAGQKESGPSWGRLATFSGIKAQRVRQAMTGSM